MYIILGLFLLLPIGIVLFTGFRNPQKLSTSYDATMKVEDLVDVISEEEEASLESAFGEFYTLTGISPYLITTDNASVQSHYTDLEDYAYHAYLKRFTDESHWLIVYSGDAANPHKNWAFEGMQGNDTDPIINSRYASIFTESLYKNLSSGEQTIASSVKGAFESIMPTIMESGFYVEPVIIVFCSIWFVGVGIAIASTIRTSIRVKEMKEAVVAPTNPVLKKCSHCGAEYYEGTIAQCRLCGKLLNEDPTSADE